MRQKLSNFLQYLILWKAKSSNKSKSIALSAMSEKNIAINCDLNILTFISFEKLIYNLWRVIEKKLLLYFEVQNYYIDQ